ncbi:DNA/RNA non-specific endonuclease [Neobacillus sp. KR4-4]|uniref:DNA/RNA non-specific endonuclease n=1 Tax=Neobacillus sp. KR4-4 TaxID=3344872 RepID=UPI0035CC69B8
MDVKYIPSDWDKMRDGIGNLTGLGRWGKGMIDTLKDLSDNLEDAESDIANYDSDGVITFQHTSQKNKYQGLFEDFEILHNFTGKVGEIVDRTIDQPFYEDMDAFVEAMRDLTISNYTTTNRVGATETQYVYAGYGPAQSFEVPKTEVGLDDLFSGDNYYASQIKFEYDAWKELNPDQDFSQEEYQQAVLNTRAFEYESIRNQQEDKEFWVQIGALLVIVGATIICPPAGLALGAAYGAMELSTSVSGKDWVSGRELGTGERWFRGLLAPLDIVPGVNGLTKFSSTVRLVHLGENIGGIGLRTGVKQSFSQGMNHIDNIVRTAGQQSVTRLKSASAAIKDRTNVVKNKLAKNTLEAGRLVDSAITQSKNITPTRRMGLAMGSLGETLEVRIPVENTHAVENKLKAVLSRIDGVNIKGVSKGAVNGSSGVSEVKTFVDKGKQFTNGRKNKLKPEISYRTGEYDYFYETDNLGRISKFETENLQLTKREDRLSHSKNTPGKVKGQDHAGHLAGDRFGGSPKIDNLVSQLSDVNLKQYKKIEEEWAAALKEIPPKKVTIDVKIVYAGNDMRPEKFIVRYTIDGKWGSKVLKN